MGNSTTGVLKVLADSSYPDNRVVVNPNDGFDLGLMMTDTTVVLRFGESPESADTEAKPVYGNLYQKNECRLGTVELSVRMAEKLGAKGACLHIVRGDTYPTLFVAPAG